MFHHIEGLVSEIGQNLAVIECGGIGFALNVSLNTLASLRSGEKAKLYISESVREDAFDLFGFSTKTERRFFDMLISVSGIGPKVALSILSANTPEGLALAIMNNNEKALTVAPGIGKKIAQRVILELKDRISKEQGQAEIGIPGNVLTAVSENSAVNDAAAALTVLGYSSADIAAALKRVDLNGANTEQIIKAVLKQMVK